MDAYVCAAGKAPLLLPRYYLFDQAGGGSRTFTSADDLVKYANNNAGGSNSVWIDVQGESLEGRLNLLRQLALGAQVPATALQEVAAPNDNDVVQLQPVDTTYVIGNVSCAGGSALFCGEAAGGVDGTPDGNGEVQYFAEAVDASNGMVWCSFVCTEKMLVSFHERHFLGLEEMTRAMELSYDASSASGAKHATSRGASSAANVFSTSVCLATLIAFSSETMLPDPTALLGEVDCIDEMVLLIAPGDRDQPDLLRRVALLRRRISALRARLYLKEKLLQEMVTPAMRGCFVSRDTAGTVVLYKETLDKISQVADRLDDARDVLNQANLNFVTGVSMRMSQSSANMDWKMQILGQVATICLPLNLLASIFGMNVTVPWQSDTHESLTAFFCLVAVMVLWCIVCSIPTIRDFMRGHEAKAIVPTD